MNPVSEETDEQTLLMRELEMNVSLPLREFELEHQSSSIQVCALLCIVRGGARCCRTINLTHFFYSHSTMSNEAQLKYLWYKQIT